MKFHSSLGILFAMLVVSGLGCQPRSPANDNIQIDRQPTVHVGMTREQVRKTLGPPVATNKWVKAECPIFGVLEGLWADLPQGVKVEAWDFPRSSGTLSIFFLDGSNAVWHTSFVRKGVVF